LLAAHLVLPAPFDKDGEDPAGVYLKPCPPATATRPAEAGSRFGQACSLSPERACASAAIAATRWCAP